MSDLNVYCCTGRLTRDPQVRYIGSGTAVCDIGLAVGHTWYDKATNQKKEEVAFIDVTLWGRTAEVAGEYLAKGRRVSIKGRLKLESWEDKNSGEKRSKLKVECEQLVMLDSKSRDPNNQEPHPPQEDTVMDPPSSQGIGEGELPF